MNKKIGIVIPCYKEKGKISKVVAKIVAVFNNLKANHSFRIYIVNDGCPENSWKEVKTNKNIVFLHHKKNLGVGKASMSGFQAAIKDKCALIVKMDADGQHNPNYLYELIPYLLKFDKNKLFLLKGSRYLWPELSRNIPLNRRIGSLLIEPMIRSSLNYRGLTDVANGFLAMNYLTLNFLMIPEFGTRLRKRYLFECSLLEKCSSMKIEIREFGMLPRYNQNWKSSMQSHKMILPILSFCSKSIIRRIVFGYFLKINLGSLLLLISISNLAIVTKLYFQKIAVEVALGITVSAGISTIFTSSLLICIFSSCIFLFYDYTSGLKVKRILFKNLIYEIRKI